MVAPCEEAQDGISFVDMSARHIALLAAYDISHKNDLMALDALYVAEPKLGPSKKAAS